MCKAYGFNVLHEMASYKTFVLSLFQRFNAPHVFSYDARHHHKLAAFRSFNFSRINYDIYLECFDAGALRATNRCTRCASSDHDQGECPYRPPAASDPFLSKKVTRSAASTELCRNFQEGKCKFGKKCHRRHLCAGCGGQDGQAACATCQKKQGSKE